MRILFVNNIPFNPQYGGIERVTDLLAKALIQRGHNVFYLSDYVDEQRKTILEYDFPVPLYSLPNMGRYHSEENVLYYKQLLKDLRIDIVVNQRGLSSDLNEILLHGVKSISVLHSDPEAYIYFELQRIQKYSSNFIGYVKLFAKLLLYPYLYYTIRNRVRCGLREHYTFIKEHSDAIVLLSEKYIKTFQSYVTQDYSKLIKGIPNPNTYSLQAVDFNIKEKIILYVGRLDSYEKCPMRLLKIWARLYSKYLDWQLLFVGDGPERIVMQNYIEKYRIERVHLLGRKNNVENYYKKASMVCLTSTYEGWGMALTEGMQFGCIPFTFDNYGAAFDIIDDGVNGQLIPAYNLRIYAERLSELMDNDEKRKAMAIAAHQKSSLFDIENVVCQWEDLFSSII